MICGELTFEDMSCYEPITLFKNTSKTILGNNEVITLHKTFILKNARNYWSNKLNQKNIVLEQLLKPFPPLIL